MARARNIKPGFFANEELVELPFATRLLFIGLWTIADREGRMEDKPKRIKMALFPADDFDIGSSLDDLQKSGFLLRYEHDGARYIQVLAFNKHQNPHRDEKPSSIPAPSMHCANTVQAQCNNEDDTVAIGLIPDSLNLIPDTLNLIPDSISRIQVKPHVEQTQLDAGKVPDVIQEVFAYWQKIMDSPKSILDENRRGLIKRALEKYSPADICKAIRGCSKSPHNMGQNDQKTKYNGLDLILRNAEKIDRFIALDAGNARSASETLEQKNARIAAEFLGSDEKTIEMEA